MVVLRAMSLAVVPGLAVSAVQHTPPPANRRGGRSDVRRPSRHIDLHIRRLSAADSGTGTRRRTAVSGWLRHRPLEIEAYHTREGIGQAADMPMAWLTMRCWAGRRALVTGRELLLHRPFALPAPVCDVARAGLITESPQAFTYRLHR